jgi:hypothetical protein
MRTLAVAIALLAVAGCDHGPRDRMVRGDTGWTLRAPAGMHVERSGAQMHETIAEVTIASFVPGKGIRTFSRPTESGWNELPPLEHGRFPADGVAFRLLHEEGGPVRIHGPETDTRLPMRLAGFGRSDFAPHLRPRTREAVVLGEGITYEAFVWVGPEAPPGLRSRLERVIASLAFPRTRVGPVDQPGDTVLRPARGYPVGSFTRIRVDGRPAYLVRSPGGFYALGTSEPEEGGYSSRCRLALDPARKELFCSNLRARWDRLGRVLKRPPGAAHDDPLWFNAGETTWDGHVLLDSLRTSGDDPHITAGLWPR